MGTNVNVGIFVSGYLPNDVYGVPRHVERLSGFLSSKGHKVRIFTRGQPRLAEVERINDRVTVVRTPHLPYPTRLGRSYFEAGTYALFTALRAAEVIKEEEIQVLLGNGSYYGGWQAAIASRITGLPLVVTIHGFGVDYFAGRKTVPADLRFLKRARYVIVQKASAVRILSEWGLDASRIIYLEEGAVDTEFFRPSKGPRSAKIRIGFAGRLEPFKGPALLLEAVPRLLATSGSKIEVLLAGDGSQMHQLRETARRLGVHEHVKFLGRINDTRTFYQSLDLFVALSPRNNFSDLAMMEAMACGLPVIATNSGETSRLIVDGANGILIGFDSRELADEVVKLIGDKDRMATLGENARKTIESRYSLSQWGERMESILRSAASPGDSGGPDR